MRISDWSSDVCSSDLFPRLVEGDQVVHQAQGGDVGDGVVVAHDPVATLEPPVEHTQQTLRIVDVALQRALVLVFPAGKLVEEAKLPEHRPDRRHMQSGRAWCW